MASYTDPYDRRVEHGDGIVTLWYPDGDVRILHMCRGADGSERKSAPRVAGSGHTQHTIVSRDPVTIEPSVLCHQCGLHGWIRDGQWEPA